METEKFLIDSNSFITPYRTFYANDITPGFWVLLSEAFLCDKLFILDIVKNELEVGNDKLVEWIKRIPGKNIISHKDIKVLTKYSEILNYLHESELYNEKALREWSKEYVADPWLIAVASVYGYAIVTFERTSGYLSKDRKTGKPKIPDVASQFGVKCVDLYYIMQIMNIKWQ